MSAIAAGIGILSALAAVFAMAAEEGTIGERSMFGSFIFAYVAAVLAAIVVAWIALTLIVGGVFGVFA